MSQREGEKKAERSRGLRVIGAAGYAAGQLLLFLATFAMVLYFSPSVQGIQAPLLAMAMEDRSATLAFDGVVASPIHGRVGVARPALLDGEGRDILKAELIEIDGAGWRNGGPAVRSVLLKKPEVSVFLAPDGSLSLMVLLKEKKRKKRKKEKGSWSVDALRIEDGRITVDLPFLTGRIGPLDVTGNVGEVHGISSGAVALRIERIALEVRGPEALVALLTAVGWTPERLSSLGPVEVVAEWDGNRFALEKLTATALPLDLGLEVGVDLDALSVESVILASWGDADLAKGVVHLSEQSVDGSLMLDPPDLDTLPLPDGRILRGLSAAPSALKAGGDEAVLRLGRISLGSLEQGDASLGDLAVSGELTLRLGEGELHEVWSAFWATASAAEMIARFKPTLTLDLETHLGAVKTAELNLAPALRVTVDAGFTPPLTVNLRSMRVDSAFGQVLLRGRFGPRPPLGLPGYEGTLQLVGIDLAAIKEKVEVPAVLERFLSGRLEGEAVFEGSPLEPERLTLSRCAFGIVGGTSPLGVHCPEGGTIVDPTQAPEVGPMTLFKKVIPWGDGKLLLGPYVEAATP